MKILKGIQQGSEAWHEHRTNHFNASDAPAMMGVSLYKTRNELIKEIATGSSSSIPQFLADKGHEAERMTRPCAEQIIGQDLYPVIGVDGIYSASFDGLTLRQDINFEHKMLNDEIRACESIDDLHDQYKIQMTQQMGVSGAMKTLFLATEWDENGDMVDSVEFWYEFDSDLWDDIKAGWSQLQKDVASYEHKPIVEKPVADSIEAFPVAVIQARGEIVLSNLDAVLPRFDLFLSTQKTELVTDEDFVNAEAVAKSCRNVANQLGLTATATIDQLAEVSRQIRACENYADKFNALALQLEKLIKSEKENRRNAIINAAKVQWREHLDSLDAELKPVHLHIAPPDFLTATKNKRTIDSLQNAVDTVLAQSKMASDAMAKVYRQNLAWANENAIEFNFLYANDLSAIVSKDHEDFKNLIESRIASYKAQEEAKKQVVEQPKPEVKEVGKEAPKAVIAKPQPIQSVDTNKVSEFINSREWPSESARNTARATCVEFYKFINQEHLQAA
jgi:putative phage-type endonuclease